MGELEALFARRRFGAASDESAPRTAAAAGRNEEMDELQAALAARRSAAGAPAASEAAAPAAPSLSPAQSPATAFDELLAAASAADVQAAYNALLASLGLERCGIARLAAAAPSTLPHRATQLLSTLEARAGRVIAIKKQQLSGHKPRGTLAVAIVGAGPIGLRTAIELAMLGARVEVLEGREGFSRLQVLHLWEWVEADLVDLGIKIIDPSIFATTDVRRCTTMQLQHSLLKICLLCGVTVRFGVGVDSVGSLGSLSIKRLDALIDASGARCPLLDELGFSSVVALKSQRALCVVLSLINSKSKEELELRESTWSSQYYQDAFAALAAQGVPLENLVYYRSSGAFASAATHYFVLTTNAEALIAYGALKEVTEEPSQLCARDNVVSDRLEAYARRAVAAFVPPLAEHPLCSAQLSIFDFSERKQSNKAVAVVPGSALGSEAPTALVTRVGDALQEPFWPEGLGINRGFLGAYDCADLILRAAPLLLPPLGSPPPSLSDWAPLLDHREALFQLTKRLSATNRQAELRPPLDGRRKLAYTLQPHTRYASWSTAGEPRAAGGATGAVGSGPPRMSFHAPPFGGAGR